MKHKYLFFIMGGLLISQGFAQTISLSQAIVATLAQHPEIKTAQAQLDKAKAQQQATEADPTTLATQKLSAGAAVRLAMAQFESTRLNLIQNTLAQYLVVLEHQKNKEVQELEVAANEKQLAITQAKLNLGQATKLQVEQAQIELAGTRQTLAETEAQINLAAAKLSALIGKKYTQVETPTMPSRPTVSLEKLQEKLGTLPAILEAQQNVEQSELTVRLSDNDWTPARTLQDHRTQLSNAQRQLEIQQISSKQGVASAFQNLQAAYDFLITAQAREVAAQQTYQQDSARLKSGVISAVEAGQSRLTLKKAQFARQQAQFRVMNALAQLSVATGHNLVGIPGN